MKKPVLINPHRRMVIQKDALSALLLTGSDKVESRFGNGDCLLLDFSRLIFAVSDGSERYPQASKLLLERLAGVLSEHGISPDLSVLKKSIEAIYDKQKYTHKCTFSFAAFYKKRKEVTACIISGGDSMVIIVDSSNGSIIFKTSSDMNFAGRSKNVPGISTIALKDRNSRVIIATDGFSEALNNIELKHGKLPRWLFDGAVCGVAGKFRRRLKTKKLASYDDIGMIIVDPFSLCRDDKIIIAGGTLPAKEALLASSLKARTGKWIEKEKWPANSEIFDSAGITIKDIK